MGPRVLGLAMVQLSFLASTVIASRLETGSLAALINSQAMLKQDLLGEDNAIRRYKERIYQAEQMREYGLRRVIEDILIQEEEHKRDLLTVIHCP